MLTNSIEKVSKWKSANKLYNETKSDYRGVIGLIKDADGNINLIKDTNMYSMPNYSAIGDVLKNVASECKFSGKDVVTWLRVMMNATDKEKVRAELDIIIPGIDINVEYSKSDIMGLFRGNTTRKEVVRYVLKWEYNKEDKSSRRVCHCDNPCTTSSCGRMIYVYPEKNLRAYPGVERGSKEWDETYKIRVKIPR